MTYLSLLEKINIFFNMIFDFKIVFVLVLLLLIINLLFFIKKISYKKYILSMILSMIIVFSISIILNFKVLSNTFDNFMNLFFSNIYFPSIYVYIGILIIVFIAFIVSVSSTKINNTYKIVNSIMFSLNNVLLIIILNIIAKNKIDVFSIQSLYTNINLVGILELCTILFLVWIAALVVVFTTNNISERLELRKKSIITYDLDIGTSKLEDKDLVFEKKDINDSISLGDNVIENVVNDDMVTFDDILNEKIPVTHYDDNIKVDNNNIIESQELYVNKYNDIVLNNKEETFQDIANNIREENVIIEKSDRQKKASENLLINTISLEEISNEEIKKPILDKDNNNNYNNNNYKLEDYKKIINILNNFKNVTKNNTVTIDDMVTFSLINNYSIDDCIKLKEILESNLN